MHLLRLPSLAASLPLLLGLALPASATQFLADAVVSSGSNIGVGSRVQDTYVSSTAAGGASAVSPISIGTSTDGVFADPNAFAMSQGGAVRAYAGASAAVATLVGGILNGQSSAGSTASLDDAFLIAAGGVAPGTFGTITYSIILSGTTGGGGSSNNGAWSGSTFWRGSVVLNGISFVREQSYFEDSGGQVVLSGTGSFGVYTLTAAVTIGSNASVTLRAEAEASTAATTNGVGAGNASSVFTSNLGSTLRWGGISELRLSDGTVVTNFSALSADTGFDYRYAAVPEPHVLALLALSGTGLAARRRRSR